MRLRLASPARPTRPVPSSPSVPGSGMTVVGSWTVADPLLTTRPLPFQEKVVRVILPPLSRTAWKLVAWRIAGPSKKAPLTIPKSFVTPACMTANRPPVNVHEAAAGPQGFGDNWMPLMTMPDPAVVPM